VKELGLSQLWVVPARQNPLRDSAQMPAAEKRVEIVRRGLSSLSHLGDKIQLREDEILRKGPSYTVDTLATYIKANKDAEFYLIIGADQFQIFHQWRDYKKILKQAHLVVTSRPGVDLPADKAHLPSWCAEVVKSFKGRKLSLSPGYKGIQFLLLNDVEVSASEIRRKIRRGENVANLTPTSVVEYLQQENIYDPNDILVSDYSEFTKFCAKIINNMGGIAVSAYDVRNLTQPSEYTLTASGTSTRHTRAICENVVKAAKEEYGIYPQSTEGLQEGRWVVVDYGALMIHVFYDFVRNEYRIEDLWASAPKISV
jgi:nicotinate-nucleotide adenylyltransferase